MDFRRITDGERLRIDEKHNPDQFIRSAKVRNDDIEDILRNSERSDYDQNTLWHFVDDLTRMNIKSKAQLTKGMQELRKKYHISPRLSELRAALLRSGMISEAQNALLPLLTKSVGRSLSGVLVVTVVTSPYPENDQGKKQKFSCEWNCYYCPNEPGQPRSYLHDEPAVARANQNRFDPILQFNDRAIALSKMGHPIDKCELIVLGGTWESYPLQYRHDFVRDLYYAANTFLNGSRAKMSLVEEQVANEKAACKIIGLTLETRPDTINEESIRLLRYYGCTRVQLGVQHTDDEILRLINRQCTTQQVKHAIKLLKNACFKVDVHLMPNLPGSSPLKDKIMFMDVLFDQHLQVDQWKIYPMEVVPWTVVNKWYQEGSFVPYAESELLNLLADVKHIIHPWIRLNRVVRDIPSQYVLGGNDITNMRNTVLEHMKKIGKSCKCIRCREITNKPVNFDEISLRRHNYKGSDGDEVFLSYETKSHICGFLRLRFASEYTFASLRNCAMIRELRVRPTHSDKFSQ